MRSGESIGVAPASYPTLRRDETDLYCYLGDLREGGQLRPERLRVWEELRSRYGGRDESIVLDGSLHPIATAA